MQSAYSIAKTSDSESKFNVKVTSDLSQCDPTRKKYERTLYLVLPPLYLRPPPSLPIPSTSRLHSPPPLSFLNPPPSSLLQPFYALLHHPSSLLPPRSSLIPHPSCVLMPTPSSPIFRPQSAISPNYFFLHPPSSLHAHNITYTDQMRKKRTPQFSLQLIEQERLAIARRTEVRMHSCYAQRGTKPPKYKRVLLRPTDILSICFSTVQLLDILQEMFMQMYHVTLTIITINSYSANNCARAHNRWPCSNAYSALE